MECSNISVVAGTMEVSGILPYLVVLCQFHGILCDHQVVDPDCKTNDRMKRQHENDCQKRNNFEKIQNKTATPIGSKCTEMTAKTVPQSVNKAKLPINERNQPKDVRTINHILEEIASLAHNHNETKGIHKIRHLVDEIDNLNKPKNCIETDDVKSPKKEIIPIEKDTKAKVTNFAQERKTAVKIDPVKKTTNPVCIENKDSINNNKSLLTNGRRCHNEIPTHVADETTTTKTKNKNLIQIEEHKYEEELLRSPYNIYNLNMAQNYNDGSIPNANNIENDSSNSFNNYPLATYEQYNGNNEYYYANSPSPSNQPTCQNNEDFMRCRKTWLDRNTLIRNRSPNDRIINEDTKEVTNIQYPDYYRKYYSVTQKQYQ